MKKEPLKATAPTQEDIAAEFKHSLEKLIDKFDDFIYPLIIPPFNSIDEDILFDVYPDLTKIGKREKLSVLLYSYGGDAHTAYHIGRILQEYTTKELKIYILREAKSAATLLACAGDKIIFSEISELGPMDPQFAERDSEQRFSPLAIKHALDLLSDQSSKHHDELVKVLADKLPKPLILGEHLKSLETGKEYIYKLLKERMFNNATDEKIKSIAEKLVTGYPDHGYCIDFKEAQEIGLKVEKASDELSNELFDVMLNYKKAWDKLLTTLRSNDPAKKSETVSLISSLRKIADEMIEYQLKKNTSQKSRQKD
jgi:hypothetical protein